MERDPEDGTLIGLAGIFPDTLRVIRSRPLGFRLLCRMVILLSLSLLAHVAISRVLFSHAIAAASDAGSAAHWALFILAEAAFLYVIILYLFFNSLSFSVLSVAPLYSGFAADAGHDARTAARDLRQLPRHLAKHIVSDFPGHSRLAARVFTDPDVEACLTVTCRDAFLLLLGYTALFAAAAVIMRLPRTAALLLLGCTTYLPGAAYIGVVWRLACVLSVLEDGARGFRAMHRSDELLARAGKFWAAAAVFTALDGCTVAVQLAFGAMVVDDRMGLGVWVRVALGVAMAGTLLAAVLAGMVAHAVVYFVCKSSVGTAKSLTNVVGKVRGTRNRKRH
ncbi:unnamed protein product [Alopecurus aequalis]